MTRGRASSGVSWRSAACNRWLPRGRAWHLGGRARLRTSAARAPPAAVPVAALGAFCRRSATPTGKADRMRALCADDVGAISPGGRGAGLPCAHRLSGLRCGTRRRAAPSWLPLVVGIASGAYSSNLIAAPLLTTWKEREPTTDGENGSSTTGELAPAPTTSPNARDHASAVTSEASSIDSKGQESAKRAHCNPGA